MLIQDLTPPELVSHSPVDGALLQQVAQIAFYLYDQYSPIDDDAVVNSVEVRDSANQLIAGTVSENNDSFTFTPDVSPFADETYTVALTATDLAGNAQPYSFSFTVDGQPPAAPTITGETVTSGVIQERPAPNQSDNATVTLTGAREDETGVWINDALKVIPGSGAWTTQVSLAQGDNALKIELEDRAGNRSDPAWVDIFVDSVAPAITSITPAHGSLLNTVPATVIVGFQEATSGLNLEACTHVVNDASQTEVSGAWSILGDNQLVFTPAASFTETEYTIDLQ
ncbi:MAG: Ig-like domain-containing protein, partial [Hyphomicrobiales bacterium]|nr:Ig-like domain-containing protein [Hyphomicrobiales bacterium]